MLNTEPDDEISILEEIAHIETDLASLDECVYEVHMQRKFLNHRLADLKYKLKQIRESRV